MGKEEGVGNVGVVFWEAGSHFEHILGEVVLARKGVHAGEVVDLLVRTHFAEGLHTHCRVRPTHVPLPLLLEVQRVVQLPAHLLHHLVLRVCQVSHDRLQSALGGRPLAPADVWQFETGLIVFFLLEPHLFYYSPR